MPHPCHTHLCHVVWSDGKEIDLVCQPSSCLNGSNVRIDENCLNSLLLHCFDALQGRGTASSVVGGEGRCDGEGRGGEVWWGGDGGKEGGREGRRHRVNRQQEGRMQ